MKNRLLAILVLMAFTFGLLPSTALATDEVQENVTFDVYYDNALEIQSEWTDDEFRAAGKLIETPPYGEMSANIGETELDIPAPGTADEYGCVSITDGGYTWFCTGFQVDLYYGDNEHVGPTTFNVESWANDTKNAKIHIYNKTYMIFITYLWEVTTWPFEGPAPERYTISYDANAAGLNDLGLDTDEITRYDRVDFQEEDPSWGIDPCYYLDPSGDSGDRQPNPKLWGEIERTFDGMVNSTNKDVWSDETFVIDYPGYGTGIPSNKIYGLLIQDEVTDQYFRFAGWLGEDGKTYDYKETVTPSPDLAGEDNKIHFKAKWEEIPALTDKELAGLDGELPLEVFHRGDNVGQNVLITQWVGDEPSSRTGDPVDLDADQSISYAVSARLDGTLSSDFGSQGQGYDSRFANFVFHVRIDENLEFANINGTDKVQLTFSAAPGSRYDHAPVTLTDVSIADAEIVTTSEGVYTISFDPREVQIDPFTDEMLIDFDVQWNGGKGWDFSVPVDKTDANASMTIEGLDFKLKEGVDSGTRVETSANISAQFDVFHKTSHSREYYETARWLMEEDEWHEHFFGNLEETSAEYSYRIPEAFAASIQLMNYKLENYDLSKDEDSTLKANTVVANAEKYTITAVAGTGGSISPESINVYEGGSASFDIEPENGFELDKVTLDGVDVTERVTGPNRPGVYAYSVEKVSANHTVVATFKQKTYTISVDPSSIDFETLEPGYKQPEAVNVTVTNTGNQTVTVVLPTAVSGYVIDGVSGGWGDGGSSELKPGGIAVFSVQPVADLDVGSYNGTIKVNTQEGTSAQVSVAFAVKKHSAPDPGGGGTVVPSKVKLTYVENGGSPVADVTVPRGTSVALATPVREGYTFEGWFFDSGLTDPAGMGGARITLYVNTTVYAKWSRSEAPGSFVTDHINYIMGCETEDGERLIAPLSDVTRAEVATMVFRLLKPELRDEHLTDESGFADVPADAWYAEPVATLAAMGAVKGYPQDGLFHPDDPITRAELVTIVTRLDERFDEGEWYGDLPFDDVPADHWALSVLSFAVNRGWLSGDTYDDGALTGSFRPDDSITRAETMAVLNRMLGRLPESEDDLLPGRIEWPDNRDEDAWYWIVVEEATNNHDHALKADGVHERWTRLLENVAE